MAHWVASNRNHVKLFERTLAQRPGDTLVSLDGYYDQGAAARARDVAIDPQELPVPGALHGRFGRLPWESRQALLPSLGLLCAAWLERQAPEALVFANDTGLVEAALLGAAKARHIPAALVQEGDFGTDWLRDRRPGQPLIGEGGCDVIAVWGERGRSYVEALDVSSRVACVGCAKLPETGPDRAGLREALGIDADTRVALFGLQCLARYGAATLEAERALYSETLEALLADAALHVVVSPHPSHDAEEQAFYAALCDERPRAHFVEAPDGGALLGASDLLVALHSTLLTEAAAVGIPAVCIDPSALSREAPSLRIHRASELAERCAAPDWSSVLARELSEVQREFAAATYHDRGDGAAAALARCVAELSDRDAARTGHPPAAAPPA